MLEWLVDILKALIKARYTGHIQIRFKNGGISSITRPREKDYEVSIR